MSLLYHGCVDKNQCHLIKKGVSECDIFHIQGIKAQYKKICGARAKSNSTAGRSLALHTSDPSSIPSIP